MQDFRNNFETAWRSITRTWRPPPKLTGSEWADEYGFLSPESSAAPGKWRTIPYQKAILDAMTHPRIERVTWKKSARVGYALALDTPIPTPTGWSTMGRLEVGDKVFDERGQQCTIEVKSPIFTNHECYEVKFCDGSTIVADADHRWYVEGNTSISHAVSGYCRGSRSGIINTRDLATSYIHRGRNRFCVPVTKPLELPDIDLPIPPYTLGLWLGDGHIVTPRITTHKDDIETADYIASEGICVTIEHIDRHCPNNRTYLLDIDERRRSKWTSVFREIGILGGNGREVVKHIPEIYLRAGFDARLSLIQGIMDSDGTIGADGRAELSVTSKPLALGFRELLSSFGVKSSFRIRLPKQKHHKIQYRVNFKASYDINPFRLKRKADRVLKATRPTINNRRRIVSVRRVDSVPVQCIQVNSPNSLYLAGDQMIPTHNTKCMGHAIGYHIHQDPCSMLVVQPTVDDAKGYSKEELAPMFRDTAILTPLIAEAKSKDSDNTILKKVYPGGILNLVGANSARGFRRITVRIVMFDEVDGYPPSAGQEGDQIQLGIRRTETFWNRKIFEGSTPTKAGESRIERSYQASDGGRFHVPCPHCQHMHVLEWKNLKWEKAHPETARFVCPSCHQAIDHAHKRWMVERGEWRGAKWRYRNGEFEFDEGFSGWIGFHIWAAYSYSPNATWSKLAEEFLQVYKNPEQLQTFTNTVLGEVWEETGQTVDGHALYKRREIYDAQVPSPVQVLTAWVDVQDDRFEYEVVGWGDGEESWGIDYQRLYGDLDHPQIWNKLLTSLRKTYRNAAGAMMEIRLAGIDSQGHYTDEVYNLSTRAGPLWLIPTQGHSKAGQPIAVFPRQPNDRGLYKTMVGTDTAKELIYGRYELPDPEPVGTPMPGYCHYPRIEEYDITYFEQATAEEKMKKYRHGVPYYVWDAKHRRNEALDCRVGNLVMIRILQQYLGFTFRPAAEFTQSVEIVKDVAYKPRVIRAEDPYL